MIKERINSNKGITIIALVITIVLLLILTGVVIHSVNISNNKEYYNKMVADINLINDKVLVYYNKYNEIPKTTRKIVINQVTYWEIDLSKLDNITLNLGTEYRKNRSFRVKQVRCLCNE